MKVSVLIPSYNHAAYIEEAVASVLEGPFTDLEVVVVDDGSTDDSVKRLGAIEDGRLRLTQQTNQGAHAALNRCLDLAEGEIFFILNSDDAYLGERIPRMVDILEAEPEVALVSSWIDVVDQEGRSLGVKRGFANMLPWPPAGPGPRLSDLGNPDLAMLETNFVSTTSNIAFRRSLARDNGLSFMPLRYTHDWEFILSALEHGRMELVEDPLVRYRVHAANTIREGQDASRQQGVMRFEILWVVARHAARTCRMARGGDASDRESRLWSSLPSFGCHAILSQLLLLRGEAATVPAAYDQLLEEDHPFRAAAVDALSRAPG